MVDPAKSPALPAPITEAALPASALFRSAIVDSPDRFASNFDGDANLGTANGTSLLMAAAADVDKVKLLLARGADPKVRAASGYDAMTVAASYPGGTPVLRALLDAGGAAAPVDDRKAPRSPLLFASMSGDLDAVSLLLARGAEPNQSSASGDSPISEAITFGRANVVRALIAAGANVHLVERTGVNLLHWATITNRADVIPELARAGVDINATDEAGYTPLDVRGDHRLRRHSHGACAARRRRGYDNHERVGQDAVAPGAAARPPADCGGPGGEAVITCGRYTRESRSRRCACLSRGHEAHGDPMLDFVSFVTFVPS